MKKAPFLLLAFCLSAGPLAAEGPRVADEPGWTVTSRVDWAGGGIALEVRRALDPSTASLTRAKGDAETEVEARLPDFLARAIAPVIVDSSHTFGDLLAGDAALYARVNDLALRARRTEVSLSADFTTLIVHYLIPFFGEQGIAIPLLPARMTPVRSGLGEVSTRVYTGLLIYAVDEVPASGQSRTVVARPALFPRIWDETMNLVWEKGMCSPEALGRWGMVGYAQSLGDAALLRVGVLPLRLSARAVFGDKATDLVVSTEGARQLLALPENIALLREGKICVIYRSLE